MKLWHLFLRDDYHLRSIWDVQYSIVVRAETEQAARAIAQATTEGVECTKENPEPWLDPTAVDCVELLPDGEPGVIVRDFKEG